MKHLARLYSKLGVFPYLFPQFLCTDLSMTSLLDAPEFYKLKNSASASGNNTEKIAPGGIKYSGAPAGVSPRQDKSPLPPWTRSNNSLDKDSPWTKSGLESSEVCNLNDHWKTENVTNYAELI